MHQRHGCYSSLLGSKKWLVLVISSNADMVEGTSSMSQDPVYWKHFREVTQIRSSPNGAEGIGPRGIDTMGGGRLQAKERQEGHVCNTVCIPCVFAELTAEK